MDVIFYLEEFDCWGFINEKWNQYEGPFRTEQGAKKCHEMYFRCLDGYAFTWAPFISDRAKELALDLATQADALGMESLTEDEQILVNMI